jgi:hypothetical protein
MDNAALERAAYGRRITFHTKHHWILTWLLERPGESLAGKVWTIINDAYKADYAARGHAAIGRYWSHLESFDYDAPGQQNSTDLLTDLSEACECFSRAGDETRADIARDLMRAVLYQQQKRAA